MSDEVVGLPDVVSEKSVTLANSSVSTIEATMRIADAYFDMFNRLRERAVSLTNKNDWIDQNNNPYLEYSGASKIAIAFGVAQGGVKFEEEKRDDGDIPYITFTCFAKLTWNGNSSEHIGTSSSKDDFFARRKNKETGEPYYLPLKDINIMDVKKKAWTNLMNRGIKDILGLSFTWEEIEEISKGKITRALCTSFTYGKGTKGGKAESANAGELRSATWKRILALCNGDEATAKIQLKNATTWTKDGKVIEGANDISKVSENQIIKVLSPMLDKAEKEAFGEAK